MRGIIAGVVAVSLVLCMGVPSHGARKDDLPPGMQKRLPKLNPCGKDVGEVLKQLAEKSGVNIVLSKAVGGTCNLSLEEVTVADAFDIILLSNNLAFAKVGEIIYVMTSAEYESRYGEKYGDVRQVKTFRLNYVSPEKAYEFIDGLKSRIGEVFVDQESGAVVVVDTPDDLVKIEAALEVLEQKGTVEVIRINYANAQDIEDKLKVELDDKKAGSISADEASNQVIVSTLPGRMEHIKNLIKALDKKTKQVLIDVKIIQVMLRDDFKAELRWEGIFKQLHGIDFLGTTPFKLVRNDRTANVEDWILLDEDERPPIGDKNRYLAGEHMVFGSVDSGQAFEGIINILRTLGDTKILSNPKISAVHKEEATIHIGARQPYSTTVTTSTGDTGGGTTAEQIEFVDTGIKMNVTPEINEEGYITMLIKPEINSIRDWYTTAGGSMIPVTQTSTASTRVMAKDGATVMIGGLRRDEELKNVQKVPFLSSIPLIGLLFRSHKSSKVRTEILIMITPHIISGDVLEIGEEILPEDGLKPYTEYETEGAASPKLEDIGMKNEQKDEFKGMELKR